MFVCILNEHVLCWKKFTFAKWNAQHQTRFRHESGDPPAYSDLSDCNHKQTQTALFLLEEHDRLMIMNFVKRVSVVALSTAGLESKHGASTLMVIATLRSDYTFERVSD